MSVGDYVDAKVDEPIRNKLKTTAQKKAYLEKVPCPADVSQQFRRVEISKICKFYCSTTTFLVCHPLTDLNNFDPGLPSDQTDSD